MPEPRLAYRLVPPGGLDHKSTCLAGYQVAALGTKQIVVVSVELGDCSPSPKVDAEDLGEEQCSPDGFATTQLRKRSLFNSDLQVPSVSPFESDILPPQVEDHTQSLDGMRTKKAVNIVRR